MDYSQELKAYSPSTQDVYQGSEIKKGSKNMPLWNKAVAIAKNPAQLAVVSDVFYNWDISQWWWLRWSTWYGKNTTQHRPNRSLKNKDSKDSNQESNSEFNLWPVYKDLENKIAEALLPVQLQWDLRSKQVYNFSENVWPDGSWNTSESIGEKSHLMKEIMAWISISWKKLNEEKVTAAIHVSNEQDLNVLKSKLNDYTFWNINIELDFTINFLENQMTDSLNKYQKYVMQKIASESRANDKRMEHKRNHEWNPNWKMYNRHNEKLFLRQAYENQVSQSEIDALLDDNIVWDWSKEVFKTSQLENEKNIFIKNLLKVSKIFEDFFGKSLKSMSLDELMQLDLSPLENVEDFSQYWLDAYYKWVVNTAHSDENTAHVNTNIAHSDEEIIAKQIKSAITSKLTYDEMKWRFDAFNTFEIIDAQIKSAINKPLTDNEKKIQWGHWDDYEWSLRSENLDERIQLLRDYILFSNKDRKTQDMDSMGHMILDESNFEKLLEYLGPSWQKQVHINKFSSFITKHNLWGKSFKDVSNAIFHVKY
jgi:hypothetical protein